MLLTRHIFFGFLLFLLVGCSTTPTQYQQVSAQKGVKYDWVSEETLSVTINGNIHTSLERLGDMALLWAAERGLEKGYSHMKVEKELDLLTPYGVPGYGGIPVEGGVKPSAERIFVMSTTPLGPESISIADTIENLSKIYK